MNRTYECMFLLDNDVVRTGWSEAKANVAAVIEKHGGKVLTARRWDERRLMYPIRHKNRATYLLSYCELAPLEIEELRNELDISDLVMRYLIIGTDAVPAEEQKLALAEQDPEFTTPEPPADDAVDEVAAPEASTEEGAKAAGEKTEEKKADGDTDGEGAGKDAEAPAETPATVTAAKTEGEEG